ncbi:MAG TPA: RDD family protein [Candidatus Obscuribacter sp.]|nr:RDD family protein [Candidatus Obscuribacter sp.]
MNSAVATTVEARSKPVTNLKPPIMRRVVAAWIYDYLLCLWLATAVYTSINFLSNNSVHPPIPLQTLALLLFLLRDATWGGRGLGKRLVGLNISHKVSGNESANAITIKQSVLRNLVLLLPYFVYQVWAPSLTTTDADSLSMVCSAVTVAIALLEFVLMLTGERRRLADRLAGTTVTRAATNEAR